MIFLKWKVSAFVLVTVLFFAISVGDAKDKAAAPLPDSWQIVLPDEGTSSKLSSFSGKWVGNMIISNDRINEKVEHIVIVESISAGSISVIISRSEYRGLNSNGLSGAMNSIRIPGWWTRAKGYWNEEKKILTVSTPYPYDRNTLFIEYYIDSTDVLVGKGDTGIDSVKARLVREDGVQK